ncbi:unnamed protein product [Rhizophagus irregularis]|nr:unnamed protein product [Rhizophagus irregularis]
MKECWHFDPKKRPNAANVHNRILKIWGVEIANQFPTKIVESTDIGPATMNNPGAIYKSRPLSCMIQSAMSLRSSRNQSIGKFKDKRKFEDDSVEDNQSIKRRKFLENENNGYSTKEIELDINISSNQHRNNKYVTKEFDYDINAL